MLRVYAMSGRNNHLWYASSAFRSVQAVFGIVIMSLPGYRGKFETLLFLGDPFDLTLRKARLFP
jgi:hypothetical protein